MTSLRLVNSPKDSIMTIIDLEFWRAQAMPKVKLEWSSGEPRLRLVNFLEVCILLTSTNQGEKVAPSHQL